MINMIRRDCIVAYKVKRFCLTHVYGKLKKYLNFPNSNAIVLLSCVYMTYCMIIDAYQWI